MDVRHVTGAPRAAVAQEQVRILCEGFDADERVRRQGVAYFVHPLVEAQGPRAGAGAQMIRAKNVRGDGRRRPIAHRARQRRLHPTHQVVPARVDDTLGHVPADGVADRGTGV